jgi:hypothetical protein
LARCCECGDEPLASGGTELVTRRYTPEDSHFRIRRRENLKSHLDFVHERSPLAILGGSRIVHYCFVQVSPSVTSEVKRG